MIINAVIVDDEPAISTIITEYIKQKQLPINIVGCARNGMEGYDLIMKHKPQFVFCDVQLPDILGFEIIEKVQAQGLTDINFIIITGYNLFEYAQSALRLGAKDILLKPLNLEQFHETVIANLGFEHTSNYLVNQLLLYINDHYTEEVTLTDASKELFVTPQHLSKIFKGEMGITFNKYLNNVRIDHAKDLLINTSTPIQEIAVKTGYHNLNNFYVQFKKITGETPSSFQKQSIFNKTGKSDESSEKRNKAKKSPDSLFTSQDWDDTTIEIL